jgi:hypothetical protein
VVVLDAEAVAQIQELIDSKGLQAALWLFNTLTGYQGDVEPLVESLTIPDLSKLLPILNLILSLLEAFGKRKGE